MSKMYDIYALHPLDELTTSSSTDLKNAFKGVYKKALHEPVSITRNRKREAVLLSAELYNRMIEELSARDPLDVFRKEYEKHFEKMQTEEAQKAYQRAFNSSSEELGEAALEHFKKQ